MAMTINTNIPSLNAQRNLSGTQTVVQTALQRLSSGGDSLGAARHADHEPQHARRHGRCQRRGRRGHAGLALRRQP